MAKDNNPGGNEQRPRRPQTAHRPNQNQNQNQNQNSNPNNNASDTKDVKVNNAPRQRNNGGQRNQRPPQQRPQKPKAEQKIAEPVKTEQRPSGRHRGRPPKEQRKTPVRIIPLGGLGEIGKNLTVYECVNDMFIVDCGLSFPDDEMPGIDIVIPDFSYLEKNRDRLRGIVLTHGHEDHIGGLPYLLKIINLPIYGTKLTLALVEGKLKEHGLLGRVQLNVLKPRDTVKLGCMAVELIGVNHSIPDSVSLAIHTPAGVIVQTGDFKVDFTPIEGSVIDLARFAELGSKGVLALLADSTNAERPGWTTSERKVGESFSRLFARAGSRRIIVATFSSNIHRVQQIINNAVETGRKVAISGRSMVNVVTVATELGYLTIPDGVLIDIDAINRYSNDRIVIITTGSQGESMSALTRMAMRDHRKVEITINDFIIISATPIPGNEKLVTRVVNELMKLGAEVVHEAMYEVHVSGHACQEELKLLQVLVRPKFFVPVHGEHRHLVKNAGLAVDVGVPHDNIIIPEIGNVIETDGVDMRVTGVVPAGRTLVDGLGVGDVGAIVLRDRKHLALDGLIVVVMTIDGVDGQLAAGPDIVSRGFVYVRESEQLMDDARNVVRQVLDDCSERQIREWGGIKTRVKDELSTFIYQKTKRNPMILPVIMEV